MRYPQLDALRGTAVLLVVIGHVLGLTHFETLKQITRHGWIGVDLFFVLSGFLITGILRDTKGEDSYFLNFYARRTLRIWPAYICLLLLVFVVIPILRPNSIVNTNISPWIYLLMVQNFLPDWGHMLLGPTWSLAVEEHFYLVWPLVIAYTSKRMLWKTIAAILVLSPIARAIAPVGHHLLYTATPFHMDGLAAGAAIALLWRSRPKNPEGIATALVAVGCAGSVVAYALNARPLYFTMLSCLFAGVVLAGSISQRKPAAFLAYTGKISYCMYLIHFVALNMAGSLDRSAAFHALPRALHDAAFAAFAILLTYLVAIASWRLLESPLLKLKDRFSSATVHTTLNPWSRTEEPDSSLRQS